VPLEDYQIQYADTTRPLDLPDLPASGIPPRQLKLRAYYFQIRSAYTLCSPPLSSRLCLVSVFVLTLSILFCGVLWCGVM
jgi:hypothetical protein